MIFLKVQQKKNPIDEYFNKKNLSIELINSIQKNIEIKEDITNFLAYKYTKRILNSFVDFILSEKRLLICEYCGQIMYYAKDKKYCSLKTDGKDCGKKARNQRTYLKRKVI